MKRAVVFSVSFLILTCFSGQVLIAMPAYPYPVTYTQPDGSKIDIILRGDERIKWAVTSDGYTVLSNKKGFFEYAKLTQDGDMVPSGVIARDPGTRSAPEKAFLSSVKKELTYSSTQVFKQKVAWENKSAVKEKSFPKTGSHKLLCILVEFTDHTFSKSQNDFYNLFNQTDYSEDGATGSVKDYYAEASYGKLDLTVDVAGPYTAVHNRLYYGENDVLGDDMNPRELIAEAIAQADEAVDFSGYDNDHDGYVDGVYIIYAGHGEEAGAPDEAIWAHAWNISPVVNDGVVISRYSCSAELRGNTGSNISRIGVICHEFGHVMGAPDFYDTDYSGSGGNFKGTGKWDIMATGGWNNGGATPAHHNAFTKTHIFNWAEATELNSDTTLTMLNAASHDDDFYRFGTITEDEYYLMENRVRTGFDAEIPAEGLIIYHVHKDVLDVRNRINAGHPQKMYPVCAYTSADPDSTPASYGNINSQECPFPGSGHVTEFSDNTLPGLKSWQGDNSGKILTNITYDPEERSITFNYYCQSQDNQGENCGNPFIITGISGEVEYSTTGYRNDYSTGCDGSAGDVVFYLDTPVHSGNTVNFRVSDENYDAVLSGRYGSCDEAGIICAGGSAGTLLSWENTTGTDQFIRIIAGGTGQSSGSATLQWEIAEPEKAGETCDDPIIISGASGSVEYNTAGYSNDYTGGCKSSGADIVYYLDTPVIDGQVLELWTTGEDYNVSIYGKYESCDGPEIGCLLEKSGTVLNWKNSTGSSQGIWIIADGFAGSSGKALLHWEISGTVSGLAGTVAEDAVIIYPNPASDHVVLKVNHENTAIQYVRIYGMMGNVLAEYRTEDPYKNFFDIDVSSYAKGSYFVEVRTTGGIVRRVIDVLR
ncbi:MAG: M6 family metalloprotease domain-containing protein [Bacteroidales bacterium]|jgi:M6 family metalloprotease-like protein